MITGVFVILAILSVLWLLTRRPSTFPPGPPRLPFFGNFLSIESDFRVMSDRLRRQYGDIFSVYIFNKPVIFLTGYKVLKEALVKNGDVFSDRPHNFLTDTLAQGKGISSTSGPIWKDVRTFALITLRGLGMGRSSTERKVKEETLILNEVIEKRSGQVINDISPILHNAVSNIICSMVFGKRFEYADPVFRKTVQSLKGYITDFLRANTLDLLPMLKYVPGDLFGFNKVKGYLTSMENDIIMPSIKEHMEHINDSTDSDFISAYIKEMQHRKGRGEEGAFDIDMLVKITADLFIAGTETTATTISWAIVYFLNYPEVQEKCFKEIKENIGQNTQPSMTDKKSLPYVEATIMEVMRRADIVPMSLQHTVSKDVNFYGYTFPKDVHVVPMLSSVLQDPDIWGDPRNFRPERFLDDRGKCKKMEEFIPFSLGPRICLGESLARMELFLFLTSMIQKFEFHTAAGVKPSMEGIMGLTYFPKPFEMRAVIRN